MNGKYNYWVGHKKRNQILMAEKKCSIFLWSAENHFIDKIIMMD